MWDEEHEMGEVNYCSLNEEFVNELKLDKETEIGLKKKKLKQVNIYISKIILGKNVFDFMRKYMFQSIYI